MSASRTSIHLSLPTQLESNLHTRLLRFASSRCSGLAVVEFHPVQPHLTLWRWKLAHGGSSHHPQLISPWPFPWTRRNAARRSIVAGQGLNPLNQQMASAPRDEGYGLVYGEHSTACGYPEMSETAKKTGEKKRLIK